MIGPQGSGEGPLKDEGCKFKVKPVTRLVFFFFPQGMLSCAGCSLLGESYIKPGFWLWFLLANMTGDFLAIFLLLIYLVRENPLNNFNPLKSIEACFIIKLIDFGKCSMYTLKACVF